MMQPRLIRILACPAVLLLMSSLTFAENKIFRFGGSASTKIAGKEVLVVSLTPVTGGRSVELFIPNKDATKPQLDPVAAMGDVVKQLKAGDMVKAEADPATKGAMKSIAVYAALPHELTPTGFSFQSSYKTPNGKAVVLRKLEEDYEVVIGTVKSDSGAVVPDPKIEALIDKLNKGDAVDAEVSGSGKKLTLSSLEPYKAPQAATFTKATDVEVDGEKRPAAELDLGGKPVTAIVVGKMQGKKWVPDKAVAGFVKRLKAGTEIMVKTSDEGGKTILRKVEMSKKASGGSKETTKDKQDEKKTKDDVKKTKETDKKK